MPNQKGRKGPPKGKPPKHRRKKTTGPVVAAAAASSSIRASGVQAFKEQLAKFPKPPVPRDKETLLTALTSGSSISTDELNKLYNSAHEPEFKHQMVKAGSIPPLVAMLKADGPLPEYASRLLWRIAFDASDAYKQIILDARAMPVLLSLVVSADEPTAVSAAGVLACLVDDDIDIKLQFMDSDGVSSMLGVIRLGTGKVPSMATQVLASLVSNSDKCREKVIDEGGVPVLVAKLATAKGKELEIISWAINCLCSECMDFRVRIFSTGIVPICLDPIKSICAESSTLEEHALDISKNTLVSIFNVLRYLFSGPDHMHKAIVNCGVPQVLVDYLAAGALPCKITLEIDMFLRMFTNRELITTASYNSLAILYLRNLCSTDLTKASSAAKSLAAIAGFSRESGIKLLNVDGVLDVFLNYLDLTDGIRAVWTGKFCEALIESVGQQAREAIIEGEALLKLARLLENGTVDQAGAAVDALVAVAEGNRAQRAAVRAAIGDTSCCRPLALREEEPSFVRLLELCDEEVGSSVITDTASDASSSDSDVGEVSCVGIAPALLEGVRADAVVLGACFKDPTGMSYDLVRS